MSGWIQLDRRFKRRPKPYLLHASEEPGLEAELRQAGFKVAIVEGAGVRDEKELLVRLGAALEFPEYYGATWDAFVDCAGDLAGPPVALIWKDADQLLTSSLHEFVHAACMLDRTTYDLAFSTARFQLALFITGRISVFRRPPDA